MLYQHEQKYPSVTIAVSLTPSSWLHISICLELIFNSSSHYRRKLQSTREPQWKTQEAVRPSWKWWNNNCSEKSFAKPYCFLYCIQLLFTLSLSETSSTTLEFLMLCEFKRRRRYRMQHQLSLQVHFINCCLEETHTVFARHLKVQKLLLEFKEGLNVSQVKISNFLLKCDHKTHKWNSYNINYSRGRSKLLNEIPFIKNIPASIENFVGRNNECKTLIEMLNVNRWVSVEGASGIGKSAIVKYVINILHDRNVFADGIIYLTLRDCWSFENFIKKLSTHTKMHLNINKI